jgi:hypothetical protein
LRQLITLLDSVGPWHSFVADRMRGFFENFWEERAKLRAARWRRVSADTFQCIFQTPVVLGTKND